MSKPSPLIHRDLAVHLTLAQAALVPCLVIFFYITHGGLGAKSAFLGALTCWIGSAYFAWRSFRHAGARSAKQVVGGFYRGVAGKIVLIATGFVLIFSQIKPILAGIVFIAFAAVQLMAVIFPVWLNSRAKRR